MVRIGLIGFGTVGSGVIELLHNNAAEIAARTGVEIEIGGIADADIAKPRNIIVDRSIMTTDANKLIKDPSISIIVEAIGGIDPALKFVMDSIENGKSVVSSNKELIAKHGEQIFEAAKNKGVSVLYEGAVAGGVPILNQLRTTLAANAIEEVYGIVNGTTNYILSKMTNEEKKFTVALKEAQEMGFAEADARNDVEGFDASYKAAILASCAFNAKIRWEDVFFEGITTIALEDIRLAKEFGYVIKLLAIAKKKGDAVEIRVHPTLVSCYHPLASVGDAFNAVYVKGNAMGEVMFYGKGAGGLPTASSVVSDIIEIARPGAKPLYPKLNPVKIADIKDTDNRYYVRLKASDKPGVLAGIAGAFGEKNVSIQSALQKETVDNVATIVIITHCVRERNFMEAIEIISKQSAISEIANIIRVGME